MRLACPLLRCVDDVWTLNSTIFCLMDFSMAALLLPMRALAPVIPFSDFTVFLCRAIFTFRVTGLLLYERYIARFANVFDPMRELRASPGGDTPATALRALTPIIPLARFAHHWLRRKAASLCLLQTLVASEATIHFLHNLPRSYTLLKVVVLTG